MVSSNLGRSRQLSLVNESYYIRLQKLTDQAVLDPELWKTVCDVTAEILGGIGTVIVPESIENQTPRMVASSSLRDFIDAVFAGDWQHHDYRRRALPMIKSRGYATDLDIVDEATMEREPFYAEFLKPLDIGMFVGMHLQAGRDSFIASVQRPVGAALPDSELFKRVERIWPILSSATRSSVALGALRLESWKELALDPSRGTFLVDQLGRVIEFSPAAQDFLRAGLSISRQHLKLMDPGANEQLQRLLGVVVADSSAVLPRPVFVELAEVGNVMFDIVPLPRNLRYFHSSAAAVVVVRKVGDRISSLPRALRERFNLTDTEARVALALFEGEGPQTIAVRHNASVGTVRQQIKAVLRKSGTARQPALLALMRKISESEGN